MAFSYISEIQKFLNKNALYQTVKIMYNDNNIINNYKSGFCEHCFKY